jgi:uncharacterized membrane protein
MKKVDNIYTSGIKKVLKQIGVYIQASLYTLAGINHFWHPALYKQIMPPWLPWHDGLIAISGICEVLFGLLLLPPVTRTLGAWLIILLLIAVFPANIQMTLDYMHRHDPHTWLTILRLPLQFVLIGWAYVYTRNQRFEIKRPGNKEIITTDG